ncbi:Glycosyl transferase family 2 family protein [Theileria parva strain Muguga]|uniref:Glycosyl transferase family 2 family protein n=1 Tax=Theileria parva strain Muguga TaxID=333668 RepID=UPI001C61A651|nr:Glycosyl transferase family 2 family protein [Theileria parva strain Muguga]EAN33025.2 Glycosyl transferase family 2 family protein [Theileria parva strain Muguga]
MEKEPKKLEDLSILVSTYNEKDNISFLVYLIHYYLKPLNINYEIVVVDDNSPDGTASVVEKLQELFTNDFLAKYDFPHIPMFNKHGTDGSEKEFEKLNTALVSMDSLLSPDNPKNSSRSSKSSDAKEKRKPRDRKSPKKDEVMAKVVDRSIKLVKREKKLGLGSSYVFGLSHCKYDFVLILDADLSHHPMYIPSMLRLQKEKDLDVVVCSRYRSEGGASGWPLQRIFISKSLNYVCKTLFNPEVTDLTGSFRLYRKDVLSKVITTIHSKGFLFQVEMILKCEKLLNAKVDEIPIVFIERIYGKSKLGFTEILKGLLGLLKLTWEF